MALHQDHTSEVQNIAYPTFPALPLLPAGLLLLLLLPLLLPLLRPSISMPVKCIDPEH